MPERLERRICWLSHGIKWSNSFTYWSLFLRASLQELLLSLRCQRLASVDLGVAGSKVEHTNVEYSRAV